jgi:hypothetical protein
MPVTTRGPSNLGRRHIAHSLRDTELSSSTRFKSFWR